MSIITNAITTEMKELLPELDTLKNQFYLAGGTALALQIGHRLSVDLDFFSTVEFDPEEILKKLKPSAIISIHKNTLHCILNNVRLTFLYYPLPLVYQTIVWNQISLAHFNDITAEKFKTVSQRGAKKDFCDLYAVFQTRMTIESGCRFFQERFKNSGINFYSVLKSLTYFIDAENDPEPVWLEVPYATEWLKIKTFFIGNAETFKKFLIS